MATGLAVAVFFGDGLRNCGGNAQRGVDQVRRKVADCASNAGLDKVQSSVGVFANRLKFCPGFFLLDCVSAGQARADIGQLFGPGQVTSGFKRVADQLPGTGRSRLKPAGNFAANGFARADQLLKARGLDRASTQQTAGLFQHHLAFGALVFFLAGKVKRRRLDLAKALRLGSSRCVARGKCIG